MATKEVKPPEHWIDPATGEYRVIAPGQTFRSVTEKIARIVLTPHTPMGWFGLFTVAGGGATVLPGDATGTGFVERRGRAAAGNRENAAGEDGD